MEYFVKEGWKLNPNEKIVKGVTRGIERNNGECPCSNYRLHDHCCCSLYVKE